MKNSYMNIDRNYVDFKNIKQKKKNQFYINLCFIKGTWIFCLTTSILLVHKKCKR